MIQAVGRYVYVEVEHDALATLAAELGATWCDHHGLWRFAREHEDRVRGHLAPRSSFERRVREVLFQNDSRCLDDEDDREAVVRALVREFGDDFARACGHGKS